MTDPRVKDAIRNTEKLIIAQGERIEKLVEDMKLLKEMVRAIKKSVVRKYGEEPEEKEAVDAQG